MPEVKVFTAEGKEAGKASLSPSLFDTDINMACIREALNLYLATQRLGTSSTKTKGNVRGGGAKPWRQKGTGRARVGSNRSPIWRGGGVTFGPLPRSYDFKVNKKKRRKAITSALTSFARENKIFVLEDLAYSKPQTRNLVSLLKEMGIEGKTLIIMGIPDRNFFLSGRNLPDISIIAAENLNIYQLLNHDNLILTQTAVKKLEERMG